jgi:tetratricopeptide (TPR) repeat protein
MPPIQTWCRKGAPRFLVAATIGLLLACSPEESGNARDVAAVGKPSVDIGGGEGTGSIFGNYLAGRFAENEADLGFAANMMERVLEENPSDPEILRRAFILNLGAGNNKRAVELAGRLTKLGGNLTSATLLLAANDLKKGKLEDALKYADSLSDNGLARFSKPLARAWILAAMKRYDDALKALDPLAAEKGFTTMHGMHAGLIEELAGRNEAAAKRYAALIGDPKEASARVIRVMAANLQRIGKKDEAEKLIVSKLETNEESMILNEDLKLLKAGKKLERVVPTAAQGLAEGLFNLASALPRDRAENVVLLYARIALSIEPKFELAALLVGDVLMSRERYTQAIGIYRTIEPETAYGWSARLRVADAYYEMGKLDETTKLLEAMAKERPERIDALINLGNYLRYKEKYKEAVAAYDRAFERLGKPTASNWSLFYSRGIALERSGQWERAEKDFLQALEFQPEHPYVLNYLGYSWVERGKNLDQAQKMIARAVEQRQNDGYIVDSMGWVLYRLGKYEEAVKHLERAVQLRPQDPVINDHLGDAYWRVGRKHEARFQWNRAISFKPEEDEKAKIEAKLVKGMGPAQPIGKAKAGSGG